MQRMPVKTYGESNQYLRLIAGTIFLKTVSFFAQFSQFAKRQHDTVVFYALNAYNAFHAF